MASRLQLSEARLLDVLFSDFADERALEPSPANLTPERVIQRSNFSIIQKILSASSQVVIEHEGNSRPIVRQARLMGLICCVRKRGGPDPANTAGVDAQGSRDRHLITLSGPLSLFQRTRFYGRAMASVVPFLVRCPRFRLTANVVIQGKPVKFELIGVHLELPPHVGIRQQTGTEIRQGFSRLAGLGSRAGAGTSAAGEN